MNETPTAITPRSSPGAPGVDTVSSSDDWVVTPRRGKPVEINALWYNAVRLLASWLRTSGHDDDAEALEGYAAQIRVAFNARFWNADAAQLFDVIDGEAGADAACRPNQLFAMSLRHPVLDVRYWEAVLEAV